MNDWFALSFYQRCPDDSIKVHKSVILLQVHKFLQISKIAKFNRNNLSTAEQEFVEIHCLKYYKAIEL